MASMVLTHTKSSIRLQYPYTATTTQQHRFIQHSSVLLTLRVTLLIVTNSSAAVGWMPTVASNCALVAPHFRAIASPCMISAASGPTLHTKTVRFGKKFSSRLKQDYVRDGRRPCAPPVDVSTPCVMTPQSQAYFSTPMLPTTYTHICPSPPPLRTHSHVAADDPVRVCVHQQLHKGALVPAADGVLHWLELGGVHVNGARQLLDGLLLRQAVCVLRDTTMAHTETHVKDKGTGLVSKVPELDVKSYRHNPAAAPTSLSHTYTDPYIHTHTHTHPTDDSGGWQNTADAMFW